MMVRLNLPKRQKNSKKRGMMSMSGQLSGITHFSDITALTGGEGGQVSSYSNICISSVGENSKVWSRQLKRICVNLQSYGFRQALIGSFKVDVEALIIQFIWRAYWLDS